MTIILSKWDSKSYRNPKKHQRDFINEAINAGNSEKIGMLMHEAQDMFTSFTKSPLLPLMSIKEGIEDSRVVFGQS
jgi:hypothetical protein